MREQMSEDRGQRSGIAEITIEVAKLRHADVIAQGMRAADIEEVMASHGHEPLQAAQGSILSSRFAYVGCADGVPFYLFGMRDGTAFSNVGSVWGLGTDELPRHAKSFWPASRNFIAFCRGHVDRLENYVDVRNLMSIAWLRRLGFQFDEPAPYGVDERDFMRFWMKGGLLALPIASRGQRSETKLGERSCALH